MPRNLLLASTALVAVVTPAQAREISTAITTPVNTSTANSGAADVVTITKDGSITVGTGTAVTQDSNHAVSNAGTIKVSNGNGGTGIRSAAGTSGDITNSGTISLDEAYTATDTDKDGDLDGPFSLLSDRYGIITQGAHTGKVTNSGTILVEGNNSGGIVLGGDLTGDLTNSGKITVLGDNSIGLSAGDVNGNVTLNGTIAVQGANSIGAELGGDISGTLVVQGTVSATGYRHTTAPTDPSKLDADDLLQGGSALIIGGNVDGGIVLAAPPKDTDPNKADEDGDGVEDAKEGTARVVSYGAAPAMVIGSDTDDITIGAVAGTASGFGLQIAGSVEGLGVYAGVDATGLSIGGMGGDVTIANGIGISGKVVAASKNANATALHIGSGTSTPKLQVTGEITANGSTTAGTSANAVVIDSGANLPLISNSGTISATAAAKEGSATAIRDDSGTLTTIENSGKIVATGAEAGSGRNIAIDLSGSTADLTIRQTEVGAQYAAPAITGDVLLGGGNDLLSLADGILTGDVSFAAGNNTLALSGDALQTGDVTFGAGADRMTLAGKSAFNGTVDFGGGADVLTLSDDGYFHGGLANASNLSITVNGGALDVNTPASIASLDVGAEGMLVVTLDSAAGAGSAFNVAGNASFADGAKLGIRLADVSTAEGSYTVLTAGSLTGRDNLETVTDLVPFMFKATLDEEAAANSIVVDVARRTVEELGLNQSQAAGYDAVFAMLGEDEEVEEVFLGILNQGGFQQAVGDLLPDHAGGTFEGISLGSRSIARQLQDPAGPIERDGKFSTTAHVGVWGGDKDMGATAAYELMGYAWSLTGEAHTDLGSFGGTLSYMSNQHENESRQVVDSDGFELAAHWRGKWGAFAGFARGSLGRVGFEGERHFTGKAGEDVIQRTMNGDWDGNFVTASAGASVEGGSQFFLFRPTVSVDYVRLKEDGYTETGGEALNLTVDARTSDELAVNAGMTLGIDFMGMRARDDTWFRVETEGGWREVLSGGIGDTTAHFADGDRFTIAGEELSGGWFARLRAIGGSAGMGTGAEVSAEDRHGRVDLAFRASLTINW